jgi:TrkA domain protein
MEGPIDIREANLPGVGKKYTMPLRQGGNLAIIVRPDGERQVYHFLEDEDRPHDVIKVDEDEAQQIAQLMGRTLVAAPEMADLDLVFGALEIDWVTLEEDSPMVGSTLGQSQLRKKTGASVIAVMRDGDAIPNPDVNLEFEAGDTLLVIGSPEEAEAACDLLES